ncbi:MAG: efflux RND transporter periplasmic adaptor subunit [Chitinispirillales bacterium]|jgi:HlyD family secretion protein|nr:efflux RND transporter periplasmic adaptor subunit [Chitinispirillales bacterium]
MESKPKSKSKSGVKAIITIVILLLLSGGGVYSYYYYKRTVDNRPKEYETVPVSRGNVERVIVSTGTLDPVGSVEVGTQVSGTVDRVLVDFNDTVKAGQIIAEIDRSVLTSKLTEAQASYSRAEALFVQSEQEFKRGEVLFEKGLISEQDFTKARTDYLSQKASLQVAKAAVTTASENVRYATIRSPVRGTVIKRAVEVGQTVAASLSAPTLFVIAEDLKKMKIMAQVDETDIGKIKTAQEVRFSVQAYPDKKYAGTVSQVRLQPEVVQNVVTYTVVISADNNDGTLLPGMTANVEFVEAREVNALTVPASVFRFQPPKEAQDMLKKMMDERKAARDGGGMDGGGAGMMAVKGDGGMTGGGRGDGQFKMDRERGQAGQGNGQFKADGERRKDGGERRQGDGQFRRDGGQGGGGKRPPRQSGDRGVLWTLDSNGNFKPVFVKLGLSDGVTTVVTGRDDLTEGLKVVAGEVRSDKDRKKPSDSKKKQSNPLMPQPGGGGPRRM